MNGHDATRLSNGPILKKSFFFYKYYENSSKNKHLNHVKDNYLYN
jgi:hypothetical protein